MDGLRLGVIGAGNMGGAVISACIRERESGSLFRPRDIFAFDPEPGRTATLAELGVNVCKTPSELTGVCDIVLLAVKPQIIGAVLDEISGLTSGRCVVSVAAGISAAYIKSRLAPETHVIRVMPNAPLMLGHGATVIANSDTPEPTLSNVASVFKASGDVVFLDEELLNAATALSGSSPAYFYRMAKCMAEFARSHGIAYDTAMRLAAKTMEGAALALLSSRESASELISAVASPGGTTLAALGVFDESDFDGIILRAMESCMDRASELGM